MEQPIDDATREAILNSDLPIFVKASKLKMKQQQLLAMLVLETGGSAPNPTVGYASSGEEKARGVPILGYAGGAILGTRPDTIDDRRLDALLRRRAA